MADNAAAEAPQPEFLTSIPPLPEDEFCVYGTVYAYPEHADALEAAYAETTRDAASESGIVYYCLSRDDDDRSVFHFFERYLGAAAFAEHNRRPLIQRILAANYIRDVKAKILKPILPAEATSL